MKVRLVPVSNLPGQKAIDVHGARFVIGRSDNCDHQLESALVSRHHCELILDEEQVRVRDMGSSNGTFVNGNLVTGESPLEDGDVLGIAIALYKVQTRASETGLTFLSRMASVLRAC